MDAESEGNHRISTVIPSSVSDREQEFSRQPSYSLEAEQSVLGALLLDQTVLDQVADLLDAEDFYSEAHRITYSAILELARRGEPADPVVLKQFLEKNANLDSVGGPGFLVDLLNTVPTAANALSYARMVRDHAIRRDLARQATAIVEDVYRRRLPLDEMLDQAESRIFSVGENRRSRRSSYYDMKSIVGPVFERIESLMDRREAVTGVATDFIDLDRMLAGLQPSDLLIVAGRPSMGKTALALNMACNAATHHRVPVAVFSLEMSKEQLTSRLLASMARVGGQKLRTGDLNSDDYRKLSTAAQELAEAPIYVDDTAAITVNALRAKARRLRREQEVGLIVVDYLQLMRGHGDTESRHLEITQISQGLKAVAKELNVPVIAISQLSRSVESRTDKRPILSDLRESGSIEQDADVVMFIFREEYYKPEDPNLSGKAELIVAKQRNGPTGKIMLLFQKNYTRFESLSEVSYG
ncbi:MAG: replicative DNA helicase [Magnetococcales bacterium]|nr:replicative DNA helicase [Magnetococcales bacterium]